MHTTSCRWRRTCLRQDLQALAHMECVLSCHFHPFEKLTHVSSTSATVFSELPCYLDTFSSIAIQTLHQPCTFCRSLSSSRPLNPFAISWVLGLFLLHRTYLLLFTHGWDEVSDNKEWLNQCKSHRWWFFPKVLQYDNLYHNQPFSFLYRCGTIVRCRGRMHLYQLWRTFADWKMTY